MFEQPPHFPASTPRKAWYKKWWVWVVAASGVTVGAIAFVVVALFAVVGTGTVISQNGDNGPPEVSQPTQSAPVEPGTPEAPSQPAPLNLEAFLTESGVAFDSAQISARKARIYVSTNTTNEQAQQIANDAMRYICNQAEQAGDIYPAANRVEVSDNVSASSPGYNAADHPSGLATEDAC